MNLFRADVTALLPHLRAYARSLTSGDPQLADDIVQDTIVNALRAQHQFTPGTNLKAWLFTILRNRFKSVITRKHVTAEIYDDYLEQKHWVAPEQESQIGFLALKTRAFQNSKPDPPRGPRARRGARVSLRTHCRDLQLRGRHREKPGQSSPRRPQAHAPRRRCCGPCGQRSCRQTLRRGFGRRIDHRPTSGGKSYVRSCDLKPEGADPPA